MKPTSPLSGKRVVLTRHIEGNSRMANALRELGAEILEIPLIEVRPDMDPTVAADIFREFASYEWLIFTSRNGVKHFLEPFLRAFSDIRSLGFVRIAAIGPGTVEALADYYLKPDLVAETATGEGMLDALREAQSLDNLKVLVITGNRNRPDLVKGLWEERAIVDELAVYTTHTCPLEGNDAAARFRQQGGDALVFASSSAVQAFGEQAQHLQLEPTARVPVLCSFGPTTSAHMRKFGIPVKVEAAEPGIDGMVAALLDYFASLN